MSELAAVNPTDAVLVLLVLLAAWGGRRAGFIAAALQLIALLALMLLTAPVTESGRFGGKRGLIITQNFRN